MNQFIIWHNPRCSKSRQTLEILENAGIKPEIKKYLEDVPTEEEIQNILKLLDKKPIEITRTKEKIFAEEALDKNTSDQEILKNLVKFPKLIERPIVIKNNQQAVIGRPPENANSLL